LSIEEGGTVAVLVEQAEVLSTTRVMVAFGIVHPSTVGSAACRDPLICTHCQVVLTMPERPALKNAVLDQPGAQMLRHTTRLARLLTVCR
jgi:hypothetical protein